MLPPTLRPLARHLVALLPVLAIGMTALPAEAGPRIDHHGHGGQKARNVRQTTPATVSVTGHGEAVVAPDLAIVNLGVTTQAPSAAEAMRLNAEKQQGVIDSLRGLGVAPRDIQTSGLNLSPLQDYSREGQPPVITGYQAGNMVTVRVRALGDLGRVLDTLVGAGANEIQGIAFQREAADEAEAEARRRAVANAAERAAVVAEAAGQRLGRVLTITDNGGGFVPRPAMMRMESAAADASATPIEAGELSVSADVTVIWEMLPARRGGHGHGDSPHHGMGGMHGRMPDGMMHGRGMPGGTGQDHMMREHGAEGGMMPGHKGEGMMHGGMMEGRPMQGQLCAGGMAAGQMSCGAMPGGAEAAMPGEAAPEAGQTPAPGQSGAAGDSAGGAAASGNATTPAPAATPMPEAVEAPAPEATAPAGSTTPAPAAPTPATPTPPAAEAPAAPAN